MMIILAVICYVYSIFTVGQCIDMVRGYRDLERDYQRLYSGDTL